MPEDCQSIVNDDDDDTCVVIRTVKMTAYDRSLFKLRELQTKLDEVQGAADSTHEGRMALAAATHEVAKAEKKFKIEGKRGLDDVWRKRHGINEWRADSAKNGDDEYNSTRRKVRLNPNADLSNLTPEKKKQRAKDQRSDLGWSKRKSAVGWPEAKIQAALIIRAQDRDAKRLAALPEQDCLPMEEMPTFGQFGGRSAIS